MWIWLSAAIGAEVVATMFLRANSGFKKARPTAVVGLGYGFAFFALSRALHGGMDLGVAYAIWTGSGVAVVALLGMAIFGDRISRLQAAGIVLVIVGVAALKLGAAV